jgi:hypothetical protein
MTANNYVRIRNPDGTYTYLFFNDNSDDSVLATCKKLMDLTLDPVMNACVWSRCYIGELELVPEIGTPLRQLPPSEI